jgi:hypothetical protein
MAGNKGTKMTERYTARIKTGVTWTITVKEYSTGTTLRDRTGWTLACVIKATPDAVANLATVTAVWTDGVGIVLSLTAAQTATIPTNTSPGNCPYYLELTATLAAVVDCPLEADVRVRA